MRLLAGILLLFSSLSSLDAQCPNGWVQSAVEQNKCYLIVSQRKNWFNAELFCNNAAAGSHLTSIDSAFENANINADYIENSSGLPCNNFWIGANDIAANGTYTWIDGKQIQYSNWDAGQPGRSNQCASCQAKTSKKWKTEQCSTDNCFTCESYSSTMTSSTAAATITTKMPQNSMTDCYDWRTIGGATKDGVYRLSPPGIAPFDAFCDMTSNGGGWTVFQKRIDNSTLFWNRLWTEYKHGFGKVGNTNHWLGNDRIHILSAKDPDVTLRIDTFGNLCIHTQPQLYNCDPNFDPNAYYFGEWDEFGIDNEADKYRLHVADLLAGNITRKGAKHHSLLENDNMRFTTADFNNGPDQQYNCASNYQLGAWWHNECSSFLLNGNYYSPTSEDMLASFTFEHDEGNTYHNIYPARSEMKLRRSM